MKAQFLVPKNGKPYNQLAVIAINAVGVVSTKTIISFFSIDDLMLYIIMFAVYGQKTHFFQHMTA